MTTSPRIYSTHQLSQAAYLATRGHQARLVRVDDRTIDFQYVMSEALLDAVADYNGGAAMISPYAYEMARLALRKQTDEILGRRRNGGGAR